MEVKQNVQKVDVDPNTLAAMIIQVQTFRSTASGKKWLLVSASVGADGTGQSYYHMLWTSGSAATHSFTSPPPSPSDGILAQ